MKFSKIIPSIDGMARLGRILLFPTTLVAVAGASALYVGWGTEASHLNVTIASSQSARLMTIASKERREGLRQSDLASIIESCIHFTAADDRLEKLDTYGVFLANFVDSNVRARMDECLLGAYQLSVDLDERLQDVSPDKLQAIRSETIPALLDHPDLPVTQMPELYSSSLALNAARRIFRCNEDGKEWSANCFRLFDAKHGAVSGG